jgi:hypothetical protein
LVWYKFQEVTWRLGEVLSIEARVAVHCATDFDYNFTIAPLGHHRIKRENVVRDCQSMRPFLTMTPPPLRDLVKMGIAHKEKAEALRIVDIETSKIKARRINSSFSTFGVFSENTAADATVHIKTYEGVYLGAEMVRVGDPVRVNATTASQAGLSSVTASSTLVMLVAEIQVVETFQQHPSSSLYFRGDVYRTIRSSLAQSYPPGTVRAGSLGQAFVEELATLNTVEKDRSMRWDWVKVESQKVCNGKDVQGRFYVTEKLMSVIDPQTYEIWVGSGRLDEVPIYLNSWGERRVGWKPVRRLGTAWDDQDTEERPAMAKSHFSKPRGTSRAAYSYRRLLAQTLNKAALPRCRETGRLLVPGSQLKRLRRDDLILQYWRKHDSCLRACVRQKRYIQYK